MCKIKCNIKGAKFHNKLKQVQLYRLVNIIIGKINTEPRIRYK